MIKEVAWRGKGSGGGRGGGVQGLRFWWVGGRGRARLGGYPPHLAWWTGGQGGGKGSGGCKGFGSGGEVVETRAPGTEQISQRVSYFCHFQRVQKVFLKDALWGGGGTLLAWWTGGKTKGLDSRGRGQGRVELAWWTGGQGGGARARGGVQGLRFRGGRW